MESVALNSYIEKIRNYLPPWNAEEILKEIRSHILDQAEGLAAERQTAVDESLLQEILAKLGPPKKLASAYIQPVTLIRPEYTIHMLFYASAASILFGFFGLLEAGLPGLFAAVVGCFGVSFIAFAILSRMARIYHLPLWFPGLGAWKVESGKWNWGLGPFLARVTHGKKESDSNKESNMEVTDQTMEMVSVSNAPSVSNVASSAPAEPRRSFWERMILKSGPRPLGPMEMFGASARIVVSVLIAIFLIGAGEPMRLLNLNFESPRDGFQLLITSPGLDSIRELALLACVATALSGVIPLFMGFGRSSVLSAIASKVAWGAVFVTMMFMENPIIVTFQSINPNLQRDWMLEGKGAVHMGVQVFLAIAVFFIALSTIGKLVRFGMVMAWYQLTGKDAKTAS